MSDKDIKNTKPVTEGVPEKSEAPVADELLKVPVLSRIITLPILKTKITISKLKAGRYNEAQQHFSAWLQEVNDILELTQVDKREVLGKNGEPDLEKTKAAIEKSISDDDKLSIKEMTDRSHKARINFIAVSLGVTPEDIEEKYYMEDLEMITPIIIEINGFIENLKKSVAPIEVPTS